MYQSRMEIIRVNHVPAPRLTTVETINPTCTSTRPTQLNQLPFTLLFYRPSSACFVAPQTFKTTGDQSADHTYRRYVRRTRGAQRTVSDVEQRIHGWSSGTIRPCRSSLYRNGRRETTAGPNGSNLIRCRMHGKSFLGTLRLPNPAALVSMERAAGRLVVFGLRVSSRGMRHETRSRTPVYSRPM